MKNKKNIIFPISILLLACSILTVFLWGRYVIKNDIQTELYKYIALSTKYHFLKQVLCTIGLYLYGYLVCISILSNSLKKYIPFLSMPVGVVVWCDVSLLWLFCGIKYNRIVFIFFIVILGILVILKRDRIKGYFSENAKTFVASVFIASSVIIVASYGILPTWMTNDSYYFVMQYGQIIAQTGVLNGNVVGEYMTWTGVTPALISSFSSLCGYETIYGIHYVLYFSVLGFCLNLVFERLMLFECSKIKKILLIFCSVLLFIAQPTTITLSVWIINNAYFMIFIAFFVLIPKIAEKQYDWGTIAIVSLFGIWLSFSRAESALVLCFYMVGMILLKLSKRQLLATFLPVFFMNFLWFSKLIIEKTQGFRQASNKMITFETGAIICIGLLATLIIILLLDTRLIMWIKKYYVILVAVALPLVGIGVGMLDLDKFVVNIQSTYTNILSYYWGVTLLVVVCVEIYKVINKCFDRYLFVGTWGGIIFSIVICLGRAHSLRIGVGDSCNRILMSLYLVYITGSVLQIIDSKLKLQTDNLDM